MLSKIKSHVHVFMVISTTVFSSAIAAQTCYEPSPFLSSAEDEYFNLDNTIQLTQQHTQLLTTFFKKMEGEWSGTSVETQCKGPDRAPRVETSHAEVHTVLTASSDGNLTLSTDLDLTEKNITRHQVIDILKGLSLFHIEFKSANHLIFSERHRLATKFNSNQNISNVANLSTEETIIKRSRHIETIFDIKLMASQLIFKRAYYSNGVYVGDEVWTVKKGR